MRTVYSFGRRIFNEEPIFAPSTAYDASYWRLMFLMFDATR